MADVERPVIVLTDEHEMLFREFKELVRSAIPIKCIGCSKAEFEPAKVAGGVVKYRLLEEGAAVNAEVKSRLTEGGAAVKNVKGSLSKEQAKVMVALLASCEGPLSNGMCRYPIAPKVDTEPLI